MLDKTIQAIEQVKLKDVRIFDLDNENPFYRYVIIATAQTYRQGEALIGYLKDALKNTYKIKGIEGKQTGWLLIDLGEIIIHIFDKDMRAYYGFDDRFIEIKEIK